jgi:hypothetical protein
MSEGLHVSIHDAVNAPLRTGELRNPNDIRNDLPPIDKAPILKHLAHISLDEFRDQYGIDTPLLDDERKFVDYEALLELVNEEVSDDYIWPLGNDIHHLYWEARNYHPARFGGNLIPHKFREIAFHKILIPRQMHNFIHVITRPPETPNYLAMRQRVKAYRCAEHLFNTAAQSIHLETADRVGIVLSDRDSQLLIPTAHNFPPDWMKRAKDNRVIEREILLDQYRMFTEKYYRQLSSVSLQDLDGLIPESDMLSSDLLPLQVISSLKRILPIEPKRHKRASIQPVIRGIQHPIDATCVA